MVANEAFTIGIWRSIIVNVDRQLQVLKANVLADVGEIGKRIDAIESYNLPLEGDDGSVWTPFLAYQDGNAFVPNLLFMFTGNTTSNSHTNVAGDARVLMTRLGVRTVVAYNLPLPSKLEPINMDRFVKRASTTVWVFDDCQSKPISINQEGLSTALWISDFLNKPRALDPKFVRPSRGDGPHKTPNVVIPQSAILNVLCKTSDAILARAKSNSLPLMRPSFDNLRRSKSFSTLARHNSIGLENGHIQATMPRIVGALHCVGVADHTFRWVFRRLLRK
ncbi:hypothetical protein BR93DRAFT_977597 [Coniochaeta sp. PMI_546]|nr:hypothetical protein BR93DRAFT_977597 [Coniochaeta sp. PMI_546]